MKLLEGAFQGPGPHTDRDAEIGTYGRSPKQMGRSKEAAPHFRSAASIAPVEVYFANLGQALWSTGEIEEAMRALRTAVRMNPAGQVRRLSNHFEASSARSDRGGHKSCPAVACRTLMGKLSEEGQLQSASMPCPHPHPTPLGHRRRSNRRSRHRCCSPSSSTTRAACWTATKLVMAERGVS